jgi:uncharacterized PurR-regulated membrane protein YhhQ (DUF165 family)
VNAKSVLPLCIPRWALACLWTLNILMFLAIVAANVLNDLNGEFAGLNETLSLIVYYSCMTGGLLIDTAVAICDRSGHRRVVAVALAVLYLVASSLFGVGNVAQVR